MCRMGSLPSDLHWRITFNKKFYCLAPMIYFMGAFLCVYFYIAHIILIENELNINIFLLYLCL